MSREEAGHGCPMALAEDTLKHCADPATPVSRSAVLGWQPIETAPKDGTWFIALQDGDTYPCEWHTSEPDEGPPNSGWWDHFNRSFEAPTHWHPAPRSLITNDGGAE